MTWDEVALVRCVDNMSAVVEAAYRDYRRGSIVHIVRVFDSDVEPITDGEIELMNSELARRFPDEQVRVERGEEIDKAWKAWQLSGDPLWP